MAADNDVLNHFAPWTRQWFDATFSQPTEVQKLGWPSIASGDHTLLFAPTGNGKTLAAFLWCIDQLYSQGPSDAGTRVLYISPLKALAQDIKKNLTRPLHGIGKLVESQTNTSFRPRLSIRTGDTPANERRKQLRNPADILITTPESLFLLLGSSAREHLRAVQTIIVDEIHALAANKRGAHLNISLERLCYQAIQRPQRIGLSATQRPLSRMAHFLGGNRTVKIVEAQATSRLHIEVDMPVAEMDKPISTESSIWPAVYNRLLSLVQQHQTTIVFVNNRRLAEVIAQELNDLAREPLLRAHHGSVSKQQRQEMEEMLKRGQLRGIVATSSLELGIDMGSVDFVIQVESPGSIATGLQRIGRAGHSVGTTSRGIIFPKFHGDLLEAAAVAQGMQNNAMEAVRIPQNPLDVLAQQLVAMCATQTWTFEDLFSVVTQSYCYRNLAREEFAQTLDMLSGRYPSDEFAELRPRLLWDRKNNQLRARAGASLLTSLNAGTIPDRGLYRVILGENGPRIGELDEEMVHESRPGETFILGASSWRIEEITHDQVIVSPAAGEPGKMPFWRGDNPGRPVELGRAIGKILRQFEDSSEAPTVLWRKTDSPLTDQAAHHLIEYICGQKQATGTLPTDRAITVEQFRDELGDWRVCILTPLGRRVHTPWALAIESVLLEQSTSNALPQVIASDDGIIVRLADADNIPDISLFLIHPTAAESHITKQLSSSPLFAARFREAAARALLLPRRRARARTPLWSQRLRTQNLLAVAKRYPTFPIILEAYRECFQDVFDIPTWVDVLRKIHNKTIRVDIVQTKRPSPFARSLVFAYAAAFLYDGDAPVAERHAQALTLDQTMLDRLLGKPPLRTLLQAETIQEFCRQQIPSDRSLRHADELHDLLQRVGDLTEHEIYDACREDPRPWLQMLQREQRILPTQLAGELRYIAVEDAARYRDALQASVPLDLPEVFLESQHPNPLESILARWSRCHGPFTTQQIAARWKLREDLVEVNLANLHQKGQLQHGEFQPGGNELDWCHPDVLQKLKQTTLQQLRAQIAPVQGRVLAQFLLHWHGVHPKTRQGIAGVRDALSQLEALPIPLSQLETAILPARVRDFHPRMLDELGLSGEFVWVGHGAIGRSDGRIAWYKRANIDLFLPLDTQTTEPSNPVEKAILGHLRNRGACFLSDLQQLSPSFTTKELFSALWRLSWSGWITNDNIGSLRAVGRNPRSKNKRLVTKSLFAGMGGRWSAVESLPHMQLPTTERRLEHVQLLLRRHGILSREAIQYEHLPGGFSACYPLLTALEQAGKVRRGYFVHNLSSSQFALASAIEHLRAQHHAQSTVALATLDPANPYGTLVPWPPTTLPAARAQRRAGVGVVLVDGVAALFVEAGGKLYTFAKLSTTVLTRAMQEGLPQLAQISPHRKLQIRTIDSQPARPHPLAPLLRTSGFRDEYRDLVLESPLPFSV